MTQRRDSTVYTVCYQRSKITQLDQLEDLCDLSVRGLEELIDYQQYPVAAAKRSTLARSHWV